MKIKKIEIFEEPSWEKIEMPDGDVITATSNLDGTDSLDAGDGDGFGRLPIN